MYDEAWDCNLHDLKVGDYVCLLIDRGLNAHRIKDICYVSHNKPALSLTDIDGLIDAEVTMRITKEDYPAYFI